MMSSRTSRLALTGMLAAASMILSAPGSARADTEPTIQLGSTPTLQGKVVIFVPVEYVCPANDDGSLSSIFVFVTQPSGRGSSQGSGITQTPLICDGTLQTTVVPASVDTNTVFHGGHAVFTTEVRACRIDQGQFVCDSASDGPRMLGI